MRGDGFVFLFNRDPLRGQDRRGTTAWFFLELGWREPSLQQWGVVLGFVRLAFSQVGVAWRREVLGMDAME
ncbi:hypothetical protein VDG1235_4131 [Verrucomicrobiia bacterium DG1235]|nr:hypothetical protein VDG1235_4131 [Verrucomicrobiae bacterium DG1235]